MVWTKADFKLVQLPTCGCTCMYRSVTFTLCVSVFGCHHHTKHHISLCMFAPQQCLNQLETSNTGRVIMLKPTSHFPDAFLARRQALVVGLEISNETHYLRLVQDLFQK